MMHCFSTLLCDFNTVCEAALCRLLTGRFRGRVYDAGAVATTAGHRPAHLSEHPTGLRARAHSVHHSQLFWKNEMTPTSKVICKVITATDQQQQAFFLHLLHEHWISSAIINNTFCNYEMAAL